MHPSMEPSKGLSGRRQPDINPLQRLHHLPWLPRQGSKGPKQNLLATPLPGYTRSPYDSFGTDPSTPVRLEIPEHVA